MRLFELANQPYDVTLYDMNHGDSIYTFTTQKGEKYFVDFVTRGHDNEILDVEFMKETENGSNMGITKTGDAFRVFASVAAAIKLHLKFSSHYKYIVFMAKASETSRVKLYDALAKVLHRYIPYKFAGKVFDPEMPHFEIYRFYKIKEK
jgi:hypothetical protein